MTKNGGSSAKRRTIKTCDTVKYTLNKFIFFFFIIIHEYKNSVCLYNGKRQNGKEKDKQQGNAIIVRAESDG